MDRKEVRNYINDYLRENNVGELSPTVASGLKEYLLAKYPKRQYGPIFDLFKVKAEFDELFGSISGSIKRSDSFEEDFISEYVDFEINSELEVMTYDSDCFPLTLDMNNLSSDDLIDIKHMWIPNSRIDTYLTFMRVEPASRGKLAEKIKGCLERFHHDVPPYAFYNYTGQFFHTTNHAVGDIAGEIGFGGNIRELGDIAEINAISIGEHAFDGCSNLREVYISGKIHYIGKMSFSNIPGLIIHCPFSSKPSQWDDEWCDEKCEVIWAK